MTHNTRIITIQTPGLSTASQVKVHTCEGDLVTKAVVHSWVKYREILDALTENGYIDDQTEILINDYRKE